MIGRHWLVLAVAAAVGLALATCPDAPPGPEADLPRPEAAARLPEAVPPRQPAPAESGVQATPGTPAAEAPRQPAEQRSPPTEADLTARLREAAEAAPEAALELAREGEERFPDGALADERAFWKMRALVNRGRIARARDEAEVFFERHPASPHAERVHRLTGVHPRPRPPAPRKP
jgi:hypothetical protein